MNNKLENILTKSAKQELENYLTEEKDRILRDAYERASSIDNDVLEIALRDILEAKDQIKHKESELNKIEYKRKRMTTVLAMSGVLYSLIGIIMYLYQNSKFDIKNDLGLILAAVGILVTFLAFFYNQLYMLKGKRELERGKNENFASESDFSIVERWAVIEKLTRDIIEKQNNEKAKSFNQIIEYLKNDKYFSSKDQIDLKELLMLRNKILHEKVNISDSKRKEYIIFADNLISKLENEK